jgi:hypothetical protein
MKYAVEMDFGAMIYNQVSFRRVQAFKTFWGAEFTDSQRAW